MAEYQGRPLQPLNDVGHRERLARAGDSEQGHGVRTGIDCLADLLDGLRLVARGEVWGLNLERHGLKISMRIY